LSCATEIYRSRQKALYTYLQSEGLDGAVLADFEGLRNRSVRYLCNLPQDALLFCLAWGQSIMVPWDVPMAEELGQGGEIIPYTEFDRSLPAAIRGLLERYSLARGRVELSGAFSYPLVEESQGAFPGAQLLCRKGGLDAFLAGQRSVKDQLELRQLRRACEITNRLISGLRELLLERVREVPELEVALYLDSQARSLGAEGMGFDTLAAGSRRSYGIHAFPTFTAQPFATPGLSIVDFGVRCDGYTSDVTLTVARGPLSEAQERLLRTVEETYRLALGQVKPGELPSQISRRVDEAFAVQGYRMPHSLGHGIGLDAHEEPYLRSNAGEQEKPLAPGMVVTIEPGLYGADTGGARLENDLLLTDEGAEVLTRAECIRLPEA